HRLGLAAALLHADVTSIDSEAVGLVMADDGAVDLADDRASGLADENAVALAGFLAFLLDGAEVDRGLSTATALLQELAGVAPLRRRRHRGRVVGRCNR